MLAASPESVPSPRTTFTRSSYSPASTGVAGAAIVSYFSRIPAIFSLLMMAWTRLTP